MDNNQRLDLKEGFYTPGRAKPPWMVMDSNDLLQAKPLRIQSPDHVGDFVLLSYKLYLQLINAVAQLPRQKNRLNKRRRRTRK